MNNCPIRNCLANNNNNNNVVKFLVEDFSFEIVLRGISAIIINAIDYRLSYELSGEELLSEDLCFNIFS